MSPQNLKLILQEAAYSAGISPEDMRNFFAQGQKKVYAAEEWLFHESTPRLWAGTILEGEVIITRGLHGTSRQVAVLGPGALISESALIDETAHSTGAFARHGAVVWQISTDKIAAFRKQKPEIFFRIVARTSRRISERLRVVSEQLAGVKSPVELTQGVRIEHDSLGERELPESVYYGVQTQRAIENFAISGVRLNNFQHMIEALAFVKKAAAQANHALGVMDKEKMQAICKACDELLAGKLHDHFVVDMFQGGAGTSTNMNANEVIANRGLEILGHAKGQYEHLHPNDHVNCSQSTNDAYPTAIKLAVILSLKELLGAMKGLKTALAAKGREFVDVLKMGRTENQDAVPMTLGQEFSAYAEMIDSAMDALKRNSEEFLLINMGATAIGTGLNSPPGYADLVTKKLREVSGLPVQKADNLVEATQDCGAFAQMSGTLKRAAVQISKICNDLRWLSSGPRCGLNEINLPPMQPGSSIMPGKVNPVMPELVNQICYQIIGYDAVVSMAAEASELELNMAEPVMAYDLLHGLMILKNACITLTSRCISGITANRDVCRGYVERSIGLVTALNPVLGYERSASIAKEALKTGGNVYDLVLEKGWLSKEQLDEMLKPENMTDPRQIPGA
ncbi:MAG: aspartate ammonia-lyase [Desulfobacteraceae bacterium]|nr:aspartate ammonia-lyase [Desulfobacteraceae bacterium]MBC2752404.1 aspartate ammonia-lyase [Desulfobacteraceae bacterium]